MTLKLEVGKTYKRRDGVVVEIVELTGGTIYPFRSDLRDTYTTDGQLWGRDQVSTYDLIEEVKPETPSPVRTVTRKEIVPGKYLGEVWITNGGQVFMPAISRNTSDLRKVIATLTLIADALEQGDETSS